MWQPCPHKGPAYLNQVDKQVGEQVNCRKQVSGQQATGQVTPRAEGHTTQETALGTRQEATSEAKYHLMTESIKLVLEQKLLPLYLLLHY